MRGPQTAIVVGKDGEEIWTDKYGRVKLQFHWDREGESNVLVRNRGGLVFEDVTTASGLDEGNRRATLAAAWADYDADGIPDLYVANDFGPNSLYRGSAGGFFQEATG